MSELFIVKCCFGSDASSFSLVIDSLHLADPQFFRFFQFCHCEWCEAAILVTGAFPYLAGTDCE